MPVSPEPANPSGLWVEAVRLEPSPDAAGRPGIARAVLAARRFLPGSGDAALGPLFTYSVVEAPDAREQRAEVRRRTRLRTGKLVDGRNVFLTECRLHDRSPSGARIEWGRPLVLPETVRLFEDETGLLFALRPAWRGATMLGVRLEQLAASGPTEPSVQASLGRTHYALS